MAICQISGSPQAAAQTITATLELSRKEPRPLWFEYVKADGGLVTISYMTKNSSRYVGVFKYDNQFKREWRIQFLENDLRTEIVHLAVVGEYIYIFVAESPKGMEAPRVVLYAYDLAGKQMAAREEVCTLAAKQKPKEALRFVYSINKRRMVMFFRQDTDKEAELTYQFAAFSAQEAGFSQGEVPIPYPNNQLLLKRAEVGNDGSLFFLTKRQDDPKQRTAYTFVLFRYRPQDEKPLRETPLYYTQYLITDLTFKLDPNGTVFLGGFYSERNARQVHGLLYTRLNADDNHMEVTHFAAFDTQFLSRYLSSKQLDRGQALTDFYLDHLVLRSDGGLLLLAEQYWISQMSYMDAYGFITYREVHHYDDIAAFSLSPDGELEWTTVIPKEQVDEYKTELSYFPAVGPSGILFFYKARAKGLGINVFVREMDYDGRLSRTQVFLPNLRAADTFYRRAAEQITNYEAILVYSRTRPKAFNMVKVRLE